MLTIALAALALQAAPQAAPTPQAAPAAPVLVEATWIRQPVLSTGRTSRGARPLPAGEVALACTVSIEGRLVDCRVESDTSVAQRLSAPALRATADARMTPRTVNGQPVPGEVKLTLKSQGSTTERN